MARSREHGRWSSRWSVITVPVLVSGSLPFFAGCSIQQSQTLPKDLPQLPPEYRLLEMLVGSWKACSRAEFEDSRVLIVQTAVEADWDLGRRFVVARSDFSFTDPASGKRLSSSESVSWFTWDEKKGKYFYWTFLSNGTVASGSMEFDPPTNTWSMQETAVDPSTGQRVVTGSGTMEYLSDSEKLVRWHSRPFSGGGFQSEGRSRRIRGR